MQRLQSKRKTTWNKNPDVKPKWATEAQMKRWAARLIEYRACGLSWHECDRLIHAKEMSPFFAPYDVLEIARWRLLNVHQEKMTLPPKGWKSDEAIDETNDKHIRVACRGTWRSVQEANGRVWEEGESWHKEFDELYPEDTTDYRQTLRDFCHSLAQQATTD